jgi:hypothetical protein
MQPVVIAQQQLKTMYLGGNYSPQHAHVAQAAQPMPSFNPLKI